MTEETLAATTPFDAQKRATELAILDALRSVVDPEIGMNVVELALIRQVLVGETAVSYTHLTLPTTSRV